MFTFFDGNKSLYLVFVGVVFSQHLELLLGQLGQHLGLLLEQLGQQHLSCFLGQLDSSILTAFRTVSWTAFRAVRTASWTAFRAVRTATSWLFF
jgi:hypothetical protein